MSQENINFVRDSFDRWNRGERSFGDGEMHPDVEIISNFQSEPYRGRNGFRRWMQEIDEQFHDWQLIAEDLREAGDNTVVGVGHIHLRGHSSGVEFDQPMGWLIELDGEGRLLRMRTFVEPAEALEAAGLSE